MKTWNANNETAERNWVLIDAENQNVGRLATQIANMLRGKHKPTFTPHVDNGDFVVVINADKIRFSGTKWKDKKYYTRSRYFGSLKEYRAEELIQSKPTAILTNAVQGMLPKNRLSRQLIKKLKAYPGGEHPHSAQKPQAVKISGGS